jgi:AraC-like DNA-binding protein
MDRHYAEPIDLDALAAYLSERRVERAQDLLRTSNLTVTEVCFAVGFSSLGSFSSRFSAVTGETPRDFQKRYAATGAPRIPGCYVFMWGLAERRPPQPDGSAIQEKPGPSPLP